MEEIKDVLCSEKTIQRAREILKKGKIIVIFSSSIVEGIVDTGKSFHSCTIFNDGSFTCPCKGGIYHRKRLCSHLIALLMKIEEEDYDSKSIIKRIIKKNVMGVKNMNNNEKLTIKSSLDAINELFGGYPTETMFAAYAPHEGGKSILAIQASFDVMKHYKEENKKYVSSLFIDLEGSLASHALPGWIERFNEIYNMNVKMVWIRTKMRKTGVELIYRTDISEMIKKSKKEPEKEEKETKKKKVAKVKKKLRKTKKKEKESKKNPTVFKSNVNYIFVIDMRSIEKVMTFHGRPIIIRISDGNKMDVLPKKDGYEFHVWDTQIGKFVENHNIKFVCYDSITQSLRSEFIGGRQNFPARADAINSWMNQIVKLADEYELVIFTIHHQTIDPANQYARAGMVGGETMAYFYKYVLYIDPYKSAKYAEVRKFWIERHPTKAPWKENMLVRLSNKGFTDTAIVDAKVVDKLKKVKGGENE